MNITKLVSIASSVYLLDINDIHGISHWNRVFENVKMLALQPGVDLAVATAFAYLHDCQRTQHGVDTKHGPEAAKFIRTLDIGLTNEQMDKLCKACELHSIDNSVTGDITIQVCLDADRLDLPRVGIIPIPDFMSTDMGKFIASKMQTAISVYNYINPYYVRK